MQYARDSSPPESTPNGSTIFKLKNVVDVKMVKPVLDGQCF